MNTDKHGLERASRTPARGKALSLPREPKLSKSEKVKIEKAWKVEIRRRIAEIKAGKIKCVPAEEVMRNAYRELDRIERQTGETLSRATQGLQVT